MKEEHRSVQEAALIAANHFRSYAGGGAGEGGVIVAK